MAVNGAAGQNAANTANYLYGDLNSLSTSGLSAGSVSSQDFLTMLTAEMQNQDPLSPMSSSSYITQLSALTQTQSIAEMVQAVQTEMQASEASSAVTLLGHSVTAQVGGGNPPPTVTGKVTTVTSSAKGPVLTLTLSDGSTTQVSLANVTQVS